MGEMHVFVDNQVLAPIAVTTTPNPPASAASVKITDGTSVVSVSSNGFTGNALSVQSGFVLPGPTLSGVSSDTTGATVDGGSARANWSGFAVPTGTLTGTLTLELSYDGGNWVPSGTTVSLVAATNVGIFSSGRAARYARVSLSGSAGSGTVTVNMMGA
jgi:hypothetical protein